MKTKYITIIAAISVMFLISCGGGQKKEVAVPQPLNISIYLDLSDRLIRDLTPNQMYRDTAIINMFVDYFISQNIGPVLIKPDNMNKIKVFFYPTPEYPEIANVAKRLNVDMETMNISERGEAIDSMKIIFQNNLAQIYEESINASKWVGCDIWDFFSNKKVDNLCTLHDQVLPSSLLHDY